MARTIDSEENVAARNVSGHIVLAFRFEACLQRRHPDQIVTADIDAAKQGNVHVHIGMVAAAGRFALTLDRRDPGDVLNL